MLRAKFLPKPIGGAGLVRNYSGVAPSSPAPIPLKFQTAKSRASAHQQFLPYYNISRMLLTVVDGDDDHYHIKIPPPTILTECFRDAIGLWFMVTMAIGDRKTRYILFSKIDCQ